MRTTAFWIDAAERAIRTFAASIGKDGLYHETITVAFMTFINERLAGEPTGIAWNDKESGAAQRIDIAGIFVQIGLIPNTEWLKDSGLALSPHGEIEIDARGHTSLPGVFAAGDCTTVPYKQIIIAMGEGAKASLSAFDHLIRSEQ